MAPARRTPVMLLLALAALMMSAVLSVAAARTEARPPTLDALMSTDSRLTGIHDLFVQAGLRSLLQDPKLKVTCFFPSTEAVNATVNGTESYLNQWNGLFGREALLYNCIEGSTALTTTQFTTGSYSSSARYYAYDFSENATKSFYAEDQYNLFVQVKKNTVVVVDDARNKARLVAKNLRGGKSIVHVVNRNLMLDVAPLSTWTSVFWEDGFRIGFSMMKEALAAAGLTDYVSYPEAVLTFFAPRDVAFSKLLARLGTTMDRLVANQTLITSLVNLHISVGKAMWRGELLVPGTQVTTMGGTVLSTKCKYDGLTPGPLSLQGPYNGGQLGTLDLPGNDYFNFTTGAHMVGFILDQVLLPYPAADMKAWLKA